MLYCIICQTESNGFRHGLLCISIYKYDIISVIAWLSCAYFCMVGIYPIKILLKNESMICSAAWWKQWISPRFKSSFLVLFCFLYGVTYKPSRAGQNCYTWCCYPQWMYLQVTIIKIYLSYLSIYFSKHIPLYHYNDVVMGAIASQITSLTILFPTVYLDTDQRKHQSLPSLAFVCGQFTGGRRISCTNGQ